jgi:diaminopimelate epimerase
MKIPFIKLSAAGNDFLLIDNQSDVFHAGWPELAKKYCPRRLGVGADGLIILNRSDVADFSMLYFNADGSSGGMCGNGGRCAASYVMSLRNVDMISFYALDYVYHATRQDDKIRLAMKNPTSVHLGIPIHVFAHSLTGHYIDTGSPHVIIYTETIPPKIMKDIADHGILQIGRMIRSDKLFQPAGTNVNFVTIHTDRSIIMRTYERGVEAETLACGTGAIACSIISAIIKNVSSPVKVRTKGGDLLTVAFTKKGDNFTQVTLEGTVTTVFSGELEFSQAGSG